MKDLKLVLKRKWYDMIASGEKKEEYREANLYWTKRILDYESISKNYIALVFRGMLGIHFDICKEYPRGFKTVTFYLGYAKDRPSMTFLIKSICYGKGKPEWGAEKGKSYIIIKLGERIK